MEAMLFTGGCRSGKSSLAKAWAEEHGTRRAFVATARMDWAHGDAEMLARVERHRLERGPGWVSIEPDEVSPHSPLDAAAALTKAAECADVAVFDCVTMWLSGYMADEQQLSDEAIMDAVRRFGEWLADAPIPVAVVTNEVGSGIVPVSDMGRRFRDLAGFANQHLASCCTGVTLAVCGLPLRVK